MDVNGQGRDGRGKTRQVGRRTKSGALSLLLLVGTGSLLGLSTNLAKVAFDAGLSALPFLAWSLAIAAASLFARNMIGGRDRPLDAETLQYFVCAAVISVAVPNLILFTAVPHVGAGFAALTIAFPPLLTYVAALALRMEKFAARRATGVLIALSGAALLAISKLGAPDAAAGWILAALCAPFFLAAGNIYRTVRWPAGAEPDDLAPGMLAAAALTLVGFGLVSGTALAVPMNRPEPITLVVIQGVAFSVQYVLFFNLQKRSGPVMLSLIGSVAAIVGVPMSVVWLGESWPKAVVPAAALIALGIALVSHRAGADVPDSRVPTAK